MSSSGDLVPNPDDNFLWETYTGPMVDAEWGLVPGCLEGDCSNLITDITDWAAIQGIDISTYPGGADQFVFDTNLGYTLTGMLPNAMDLLGGGYPHPIQSMGGFYSGDVVGTQGMSNWIEQYVGTPISGSENTTSGIQYYTEEWFYQTLYYQYYTLLNPNTATDQIVGPEGQYYEFNAGVTSGEFNTGNPSIMFSVPGGITSPYTSFEGCLQDYVAPNLSVGMSILSLTYTLYDYYGRSVSAPIYVKDGVMSTFEHGQVYLFNPKDQNKDKNLQSSKKFEKILTNLRKILSFAK